jgi:hypothetical protein
MVFDAQTEKHVLEYSAIGSKFALHQLSHRTLSVGGGVIVNIPHEERFLERNFCLAPVRSCRGRVRSVYRVRTNSNDIGFLKL